MKKQSILLNDIQSKMKWAACYLYIVDATLFPYTHDIIPSMMKIFIVLSLGA